MGAYSKFNVIYRLQKWLDSVPGQTFLNYAYSWGASLVILGALFKLTHLAGGNLMLFIGMGTEVFVFFLSAFDRPFDKTADGRDIPTRVTEEYLEMGQVAYGHDADSVQAVNTSTPVASAPRHAVVGYPSTAEQSVEEVSAKVPLESQVQQVENEQQLQTLAEAQDNYVDALERLTETLGKVSEQSVRLTRDSEEMENLNRTLTGISKVYEMQLKGASQQIGTIDQINEQTRKMAQQIEQLNKIYARMIEAMTVNMRAANPGLEPSQE